MKIYNIVLASLVAVAIVGCGKEVNTPSEWGDINIPLDPSKHYIHFDADITTRGALIEGNILQADFSVLGYQYPGWWEAEKVLASPNVFDKTPEIVYYRDNGLYDYLDTDDEKLKVWTGNRYSFFGYYPKSHANIKLFDNGAIKEGEPYITYTHPISSNPSSLIDVMTASYIDTGVASSASVPMQFYHRLSAIDVGARNYYEYDHDNDDSTADIMVTIEIVNLEINLDNVAYNSAKIYLDNTINTVPDNSTGSNIEISYKIVDKDTNWALSSYDVEPNTTSDRAMRVITTQSGENASSILLIPQTQFLHGALKLTYKKKYQDDNGNWVYLHEGSNTEDFEFTPDLGINFTKQLIEGRRYYIELTFTSDAVSVNIIAADEWDDKDDIRHEFE